MNIIYYKVLSEDWIECLYRKDNDTPADTLLLINNMETIQFLQQAEAKEVQRGIFSIKRSFDSADKIAKGNYTQTGNNEPLTS